MRSMVRSRDKNVQPDPLLANCILFAPNENNPLCTKPNPDVPCSPVEWSYKVPEIGTYNVKITTGDAEKKNVESLAVNGKMIFDNLVLEPNQFDSAEIEVQVSDGSIVIEALCDNDNPAGHCKNVWTRMCSIEITKVDAPADDDGADDAGTQNMGCGNSYKGGRCDDGSDPENCIYANPGNKGADKCSGTQKLITVP